VNSGAAEHYGIGGAEFLGKGRNRERAVGHPGTEPSGAHSICCCSDELSAIHTASFRFIPYRLTARRKVPNAKKYTPAYINRSTFALLNFGLSLMSTPQLKLSQIEVRVLGALIEKDITTPDYYPLSLNALVNACNQKNNRDPVMALDENSVRDALSSLQEKRLAGPAGGADSRVSKYEHRLQEVFNFDRRETAVVCVLLLRGPQTPGELRGRTERMYRFETLDDVQSALQRLMDRQPPLVSVLSRQPGTKESRYTHLFSGEYIQQATTQPAHPSSDLHRAPDAQRIASLEAAVESLKSEVEELRRLFSEFAAQFE
jgi:hypothetical protein